MTRWVILEQEDVHLGVGQSERIETWQHEYDEIGTRTATIRPHGRRIDWLTYGSVMYMACTDGKVHRELRAR